jgi:hypothetical protein
MSGPALHVRLVSHKGELVMYRNEGTVRLLVAEPPLPSDTLPRFCYFLSV